MANLADDDLLLVQRTSAGISTNYSITGSALKEDLGGNDGLIVPPVSVLTPLNGSGITEFNQYEPLSSVITAVGEAGTIAKDTDEILSVAAAGTQPAEVYYMTSAPTNLADVLANGVPYVDGQSLAAGSKIVFVRTATSTGQVFSSNGTTGFIMIGDGAGFYSADGTRLGGGGSYNNGEYTLFNYDDEDPSTASPIYKIQTHSSVAYTVMAVSSGTGPTLNAAAITTLKSLSFPTNTNFSGLSVGDEVQTGVSITAIDASATPPTITVDGGTWDTSNQSEVWSDASSFVSSNGFNSSYPAKNAFDGSSGTYAQATSSGGNITFTPSTPISYSSSIKILMPSAGAQAVINGGSAVNVGNTVETTIASGSGTLTTLVLTASNIPGVIYIKVDDKFLVDASEDSQAWGDYITISEGPEGNYNTDTTNMFDGNTSTATSLYSGNSRPTTVVLTPPSPITVTSGLRVWMAVDRGQSISVNGSQTNASVSAGWNNTGFTGTLTTLTIGPANAGSSSNIGAIEIDGKLMLTPGARGIGDRKLTSSTPYETSLTFTDTTELANMVAPLEMADATGNNSLTPTTSNVVSAIYTPPAPYFSTTLYTGDNQSNRTISTGVDNSGHSLVWIKNRTNATYPAHYLTDTKRGASYQLYTNNNSEHTGPYTNDFQEFLSDGFKTSFNSRMNQSGTDYVAWNFRAMPGFFDIVTWNGDGYVRDIPHNLGSKPGFIIIKRYTGTEDWTCYHRSLPGGANGWIQLNGTSQASGGTWFMNDTEPTSTHFTIGTHDRVNTSGHSYIAYVFAHSEETSGGSIKCGSYTGNGLSSGPEVDLGFEPAWVMIKCSSSSQGGNAHWVIFDNERDQSNPNSSAISANVTDREYTDADGVVGIDILSNGFKLKDTNSSRNTNGATYIYIAIAKETGESAKTELTFQDNTDLSSLTSGMTITSNGGEMSVSPFNTNIYTGNGGTQSIDTGIDLEGAGGMVWIKNRTDTSHYHMYDTERGVGKRLRSNDTNQEDDFDISSPTSSLTSFNSNGFTVGDFNGINGSNDDIVSWTFRKSPGFFDIQRWTGNGVAGRTIPHNLGSAPGMILAKRLNDSDNWVVYHKSLGATHPIILNTHAAAEPITNRWNDTEPTSTEFTVGTWPTNGDGFEYVAYLFADDPSNQIKCGSYTGEAEWGTALEINLGFEPHWVLIKNSDNHGKNWVLLDSVRGWANPSGGASEYLIPNENNAESGGTLGWKTSTGFVVQSSSLTNGNSQNFIYMAIGSPIVSGGPATGTLITDADPSTNKVSVDVTSWPTGDSVSGPLTSASLTSILEVSGNTIFGNGSNGSWIPGYYAEGSEINAAPPGPSEVTFTSQNQGTPAFSGVDATLTSRTWTLESGATATGPWTLVDSYVDYDALNSQDGATPWTSNKPTLQPNTYYRIKVQYNSNNADSVESVYNTFRTGDS